MTFSPSAYGSRAVFQNNLMIVAKQTILRMRIQTVALGIGVEKRSWAYICMTLLSRKMS